MEGRAACLCVWVEDGLYSRRGAGHRMLHHGQCMKRCAHACVRARNASLLSLAPGACSAGAGDGAITADDISTAVAAAPEGPGRVAAICAALCRLASGCVFRVCMHASLDVRLYVCVCVGGGGLL